MLNKDLEQYVSDILYSNDQAQAWKKFKQQPETSDRAINEIIKSLLSLHTNAIVALDPDSIRAIAENSEETASRLAYYAAGMIYKHIGRYDDAVACFTAAMSLQPKYESNFQYECAGVYIRTGNFNDARSCLRMAIRKNHRKGAAAASRSSRKYRTAMGLVVGLQGDVPSGLTILNDIHFPENEAFGECVNRMYRGELLLRAGKPAESVECATIALDRFSEMGSDMNIPECLNTISQALLRTGRVESATATARACFRRAVRLGDQYQRGRCYLVFSQISAKTKDYEDVSLCWTRARQILSSIGAEWLLTDECSDAVREIMDTSSKN